MNTTKVTVWHRVDRGRFCEVTEEVDTMLHLAEYSYDVDLSRMLVADPVGAYVHTQAFRANNHVDDSACEVVPNDKRSLSVGDVVEVDGRYFAVDRFGWSEIVVALMRI